MAAYVQGLANCG